MFGGLTEVYASLAIRLSYPFLFRTCPFQKPFDTIYDLGMDYMGYDPGHNATSARLFKNIFGSCETVTAYGTYQYDYDKYDGFRTNEERKPFSEKQLPIDLRRAYEIGHRMANRIQNTANL